LHREPALVVAATPCGGDEILIAAEIRADRKLDPVGELQAALEVQRG
jgi:hypothetical protein